MTTPPPTLPQHADHSTCSPPYNNISEHPYHLVSAFQHPPPGIQRQQHLFPSDGWWYPQYASPLLPIALHRQYQQQEQLGIQQQQQHQLIPFDRRGLRQPHFTLLSSLQPNRIQADGLEGAGQQWQQQEHPVWEARYHASFPSLSLSMQPPPPRLHQQHPEETHAPLLSQHQQHSIWQAQQQAPPPMPPSSLQLQPQQHQEHLPSSVRQPQRQQQQQKEEEEERRSYHCDVCGRGPYKNISGVKRHKRSKHPTISAAATPLSTSTSSPLSRRARRAQRASAVLNVPSGFNAVKDTTTFNEPMWNDGLGGPKDLESDLAPISLFRRFFDNDMLDHCVHQTNAYAERHNICWRRGGQVVSVDRTQMLKYFGLVLTMGVVHYPRILDYFRDPAYHGLFGNKMIKSTMSYGQFHVIHRAFHFDLDFIVQSANENVKKYWTPFQQVTVDEWMVPFKGRIRFRQHVRGKPHATGIKNFCIADTVGYMYHFWIYRGKGNDNNEGNTKHDYVWNRIQKLPTNRKYVVFADQFYGSLNLVHMLHKHGHQFVLSCQANQPSELFSQYLHRFLKK